MPSGLSVEDVSVRAAFDLSYQTLPADTARLYRTVGLLPGADFNRAVVAAAADLPIEEADRLLGMLVDASMLEERGEDSFGLHDLLHLHARVQAEASDPPAERQAVVRRAVAPHRHRGRPSRRGLGGRDDAAQPGRPLRRCPTRTTRRGCSTASAGCTCAAARRIPPPVTCSPPSPSCGRWVPSSRRHRSSRSWATRCASPGTSARRGATTSRRSRSTRRSAGPTPTGCQAGRLRDSPRGEPGLLQGVQRLPAGALQAALGTISSPAALVHDGPSPPQLTPTPVIKVHAGILMAGAIRKPFRLRRQARNTTEQAVS